MVPNIPAVVRVAMRVLPVCAEIIRLVFMAEWFAWAIWDLRSIWGILTELCLRRVGQESFLRNQRGHCSRMRLALRKPRNGRSDLSQCVAIRLPSGSETSDTYRARVGDAMNGVTGRIVSSKIGRNKVVGDFRPVIDSQGVQLLHQNLVRADIFLRQLDGIKSKGESAAQCGDNDAEDQKTDHGFNNTETLFASGGGRAGPPRKTRTG